MVTIHVNFENSNKFFFEGEKLSGKVEVSVDEPVNVTNVLACFLGECCCILDSASPTKTKTNQMAEKETYFYDVLPLFLAKDEERSVFSRGVHSFNFEFQLPSSLPTSVESPQGYIRYSVDVIADVGGGVIVKSTHYFTVVSKVDLNTLVAANLPIILWKHENQCILSFLCLRSGPVRAFVHVAKKGFVPGEFLTVNAEVKNFNRLPISWVKACIVQIFKYNGSKVVKRKRIVAEMTRGCVLPFDSQVWRSESLYIPAIPPTTCHPKRLVNVKYKFYFLIKTSWQEKTTTLKQNLLIGAFPLMECRETEERGQGEGEGIVNDFSCHYSNLEPCIFGPHSVGDENTISFSPLYPVYTEPFDV